MIQLAFHARQAKKAIIKEYAIHHDDPIPPAEIAIVPPDPHPGMDDINLNDDGDGMEKSEVNERMVEGGIQEGNENDDNSTIA